VRPAVALRENEPMSDRFATIDSAEIFNKFVTAINSHNVESLTSLMTTDHVFIDALGNRVRGATSMEAGWRGYFAMCPDYRIQTEDLMAKGGMVLAVGEAGGTIDGVAWRTPAAWKAVIHDGRVAEWRVFADNKPVYEILARRQR
jgi:ketosteroid isomerase-like protein